MRYIRTKDGRIAEIKENMVVKVCDDATRLVYKEEPYLCVLNGNDDILKQAETIKELCDELIIKNPNNDGYFYRKVFVYEGARENILNEKNAKHCTNRDIYEHDVEIFGAIWVIDSNGAPTLKSVAKMNDKGELELL